MEMLSSPDFWIGMLKIIWVNLLLSGDNAVVIALAALGHAITGFGPLIDVRLRTLFVVLTAPATIWKVGALARNGWFERHSW